MVGVRSSRRVVLVGSRTRLIAYAVRIRPAWMVVGTDSRSQIAWISAGLQDSWRATRAVERPALEGKDRESRDR